MLFGRVTQGAGGILRAVQVLGPDNRPWAVS